MTGCAVLQKYIFLSTRKYFVYANLKNIKKQIWKSIQVGFDLPFLSTSSIFPYIVFVGENTAGINNIKVCQAIWNKIRLSHLARNQSCNQGGEKGAQWFEESKMIRVKNFLPNPPAQWVKKCYNLLFSKCDKLYIKDTYRIHKKQTSVYRR